MESSFGVCFYLRKHKHYTNGDGHVYIRITVDGKATEISSKRKCNEKCWDKELGRMKGKDDNAKLFNAYLDTYKQKVFEAKRKLIELDIPLTAEAIKDLLLGKEAKKEKHMLMEVFQQHNDQMKALIGLQYAEGTYERFETSYRHTQAFLQSKYNVNDIDVSKIKFDFIEEYDFGLRTVRKCDHNTTIKYLSNFRKIVNRCIRNGWLITDPFSKFKMTTKEVQRQASNAEYKQININDIDFSPLNYRKLIDEDALQLFADELKLHGILSSLVVRPLNNRYELVAGERRLRAAKLAAISTVPAAIIDLSDEQVIEIQLSENLQRENTHPMEEARAIGVMQQQKKSIDEISLRLGKSKKFVYSRIKLLDLVESLQEMFLADKINIRDAYEIASVSEDSQREFFEEYCQGWQKKKEFRLNDVEYSLSHFKYNLKEAPFNLKDKNLIPDAGSCVACPFNSGTLKTLFPEFAKEATCNNKGCYRRKCTAHLSIQLVNIFEKQKLDAFIFSGEPDENIKAIIETIDEAKALPHYHRYRINIIEQPEVPDSKDYDNGDEDDPDLMKTVITRQWKSSKRKWRNLIFCLQAAGY